MKRSFILRSAFAAALLGAALAAHAAGRLVINPILTAHDDGTGRVDSTVAYRDYLDKIYAQADLQVDFLAPTLLNDDDYYDFNLEDVQSLFETPGHGQSSDPLVINAYFSNTVNGGFGTQFGFGAANRPYLVMNVSAILAYSTVGRVDTFAHELGHVLNLPHHEEVYPNEPNQAPFLMTSGDLRTVPQTLSDVTPDGAGLSRLNTAEIGIMNSSRFVQAVPEPASLTAMGLGIVALVRRRRRA